MKKRLAVVSLVIVIVVASIFATTQLLLKIVSLPAFQKSGFHVGVSFNGNTTAQAELLIDRVKNFTNLFVVQSGPVSVNETSLNEIVNYAVVAKLDVLCTSAFLTQTIPGKFLGWTR